MYVFQIYFQREEPGMSCFNDHLGSGMPAELIAAAVMVSGT
jgi:hypothetical protein